MSFTAPIPLVLKIPYVHALFRNVVHVSEIFCTCDRCCDVSSKKQHEVIPAARDCRDRRGPHTGALWSGGNLDPPTSATVSTPGSHHMVFFAKKNMVKSFLHHLDLPIETLTVRSSRGYESQAIVLLLLPSNLADIFKTNWTVRVSGQ